MWWNWISHPPLPELAGYEIWICFFPVRGRPYRQRSTIWCFQGKVDRVNLFIFPILPYFYLLFCAVIISTCDSFHSVVISVDCLTLFVFQSWWHWKLLVHPVVWIRLHQGVHVPAQKQVGSSTSLVQSTVWKLYLWNKSYLKLSQRHKINE